MKRKDLTKTIITDNQSQPLPKIWRRELEIPITSGKIITFSGVRRSGKTYHLLNIIKHLHHKGKKTQQILYINFEDERLDLTVNDLDLIVQAYRELHPNLNLSECYFLFDEIQEVQGWEKFVARLYNTISKHIFITGSNSTLLSQEIATALRGRTITFEIYPLSFKEFVNIQQPRLNSHNSDDKTKLINLFKLFLKQGGFPELLELDDNLKTIVLQEYFNVMVFRDLIDRYKISQTTVLKYFCKKTIANSAGEFSVHKIFNELKSQGYKIGKDTLYSFQNYIHAIYLASFTQKYAHSIIKTELSQKKSYVIDTGLGTAINYKLSQDIGRLLETTVALELLKQGKHITYLKNGFECDFLVVEKGHVTQAIQVTCTLSDEKTHKRELNGIIQACKQFNLKKGTIITLDQTNTLKHDTITINIVPAWQYFFEN